MNRRYIEVRVIDDVEESSSYERILSIYYRWMIAPVIKRVSGLLREQGKIHILDVGCGPGKIAIEILRIRSNIYVCGIDMSTQMLRLANENARQSDLLDRCIFMKMNAGSLSFKKNSFDLALCINMLHHQKDPVFILKEIKRVVKDDGVIIIRDLIRPQNRFLLEMYVGFFGLPYNKVMKEIYRQSLYSAFSVQELIDITKKAGIDKVRVINEFPHFVTLIKKFYE